VAEADVPATGTPTCIADSVPCRRSKKKVDYEPRVVLESIPVVAIWEGNSSFSADAYIKRYTSAIRLRLQEA